MRLKYIDAFTDRHGRVRHYFRRGKGPRITLPGLPDSPEFLTAYQTALAGEMPELLPKSRGAPGTFDLLVQRYYESASYVRLAPSTRAVYRSIIDGIMHRERIGHRRVDQLRREHVDRMMARLAATPAAANHVLKKVRLLIQFAIANGWRRDDPTQGLEYFAEGEHHTWTEEELEAFQRRWPIGTIERTAFAVLLFTGQRLGDVTRMSWRDLEGGGIQVAQSKTGTKLWLPLHPELAAILEQWPRSHVSLLTNMHGRPYAPEGLGKRLAGAIAKAGLPTRCVVHGLRKAAARRLADAGCTVHQIMAITGHRSLKEVARYTKSVEQRRLAADAMARLTNKNSQT